MTKVTLAGSIAAALICSSTATWILCQTREKSATQPADVATTTVERTNHPGDVPAGEAAREAAAVSENAASQPIPASMVGVNSDKVQSTGESTTSQGTPLVLRRALPAGINAYLKKGSSAPQKQSWNRAAPRPASNRDGATGTPFWKRGNR